jgi:hypothetical protein
LFIFKCSSHVGKSFGLLFFLKRPKNYKKGPMYLYLRLTVDGAARELSTKRLWEPSRWSAEAGRATGTREDAKSLNLYLDTLRAKVHDARRVMMEADRPVTAESLKNVLAGKNEAKRMVLEIFRHHNEQMKEVVGREFAPGTLERYRTSFVLALFNNSLDEISALPVALRAQVKQVRRLDGEGENPFHSKKQGKT